VTAVFLVLFYVTPPADPQWRFCPFHWLTGLDCPLCGLTRAMFALAKGHWAESARLHALAPLAVAMLLSILWRTRWTGRLWAAGIGAFVVFGAWRLAV
jgi:hypothetical protein